MPTSSLNLLLRYVELTLAYFAMSPEYPEFTGSENISLNSLNDAFSDGYLWKQFYKLVTDRTENIDVWYESPAVKLIQDPQSKIVLGVEVERGGETLNIRAVNGIVLATGGFEANPEMIADYLGITKYHAIGGLYNTGDGVKMAMEVGADLWHMEAYEGIANLGGSTLAAEPGTRGGVPTSGPAFTTGSTILVSGSGERFLKEDETSRHGHIKHGDAWINARRPLESYIIWDEASFAHIKDNPSLSLSTVYEADSVAALATEIGIDPAALEETVTNFNSYATTGYDPEFGRDAANMTAFSGDKYYAAEVVQLIINTQGGPRRNENSEVLDVNGDPIPHLYSAGELGGITAYQYQGGGNIAECVVFGEIAGKNAATVKDELPLYTVAPVESAITHTPGTTTDLVIATVEVETAENEYLGTSDVGMGGPLTVKVTMDGDSIAAVEVIEQTESEGIADPALDTIPDAIVAAGSTEVDTIAGATLTSNAIIEAVNDALSKIG